jgi:L-threonylcarbamoyladenylate synthase
MNTIIFEIDKENINTQMIREAAALLKNGGLVAFPTETVYGLGGDAFSSETLKKSSSQRTSWRQPSDSSYSFYGSIRNTAEKIPNEAIFGRKILARTSNMIFKAKKNVPSIVTGGLDTVGIRMPSDKLALELLKTADIPVAAPMSNISGRPSPTKGEHVLKTFPAK